MLTVVNNVTDDNLSGVMSSNKFDSLFHTFSYLQTVFTKDISTSIIQGVSVKWHKFDKNDNK